MIRLLSDNVLIVLEPLPTQSAGGLALVNINGPKARASRTAKVIASGPGYWYSRRQRIGAGQFSAPTEVFVSNETKPGDRVIVDADAGQDYRLDVNVPRTNGMAGAFDEVEGDHGKFRIVREHEIYAVLEDDEAQAAE